MAITQLATESLLLSKRVEAITYDPFCLFKVDDYLPLDTYQALLETFPEEQWLADRIEGDKHRVISSYSPEIFGEFVRKYPLWGEFFQFLGSQGFLSDLHALIRRGLFRSRGFLSLRRWCHAANDGRLRAIVREPVEMQFEFSRLGPGSFVPPHTDVKNKLVSLLLYFPDPKWQGSYGGSTEFYRTKNPAMDYNWDNRRASFKDLIPFFNAQFVPNRLVVFLKSKNSYHAVRPIACPQGMARNSLNINVNCVQAASMRDLSHFLSRANARVIRSLGARLKRVVHTSS